MGMRRIGSGLLDIWRCLRIGLVACLLCMAVAQTAMAEPVIVATLKFTGKATTMSGELRFDLGGGKMQGKTSVETPLDAQSQIKTLSGSVVTGKVKLSIAFDGDYSGGSYGSVEGTVTVSGTVTDGANCTANVSGPGVYIGSVSAPLGMVEVRILSQRMTLQGCNLASPQQLGMVLPPFTFAKTDVRPTLVAPPSTLSPAVVTVTPGTRTVVIATAPASATPSRTATANLSTSRAEIPTRTVTLAPDLSSGPVLGACVVCSGFLALLVGLVVVVSRSIRRQPRR